MKKCSAVRFDKEQNVPSLKQHIYELRQTIRCFPIFMGGIFFYVKKSNLLGGAAKRDVDKCE